MTLRAFSCFVLLTAMSALAAGEGSFVAKAGLTKAIPSVGAPDKTIDLFIPEAYMKETTRNFPILFVSSPNGNPNLKTYTSWAERQGVIVLGINASKNGPTEPIVEAQDAAIKTVEPVLRLHPCLRFAVGMSGAAQASWVLGTRYPDKFAGILMMGQGGFSNLPPKHIAVAYIYGEKEPMIQSIESNKQRLAKNGNPLKHLIIPGGHVAGNAEQQAEFLDWMLELGRLTHPKLAPAEMLDAKKTMQNRLTEAGKVSDPRSRKSELERLLKLPTVSDWPESKPFIGQWLAATTEAAAKLDTPVEKYGLLSDALENPWSMKADSASRGAVDKQLTELRRDPAVKPEYEADTMFKQCAAMEAQAGNKKAQLQSAKQAYEALAQRHPNTRSGKKAADAAARLAEAK